METCKVEFINQSGQKIIIDFTLDDDGSLEFKPSYDPVITDPKTNLGLGGQLCEVLIAALIKSEQEMTNTIVNSTSSKVGS